MRKFLISFILLVGFGLAACQTATPASVPSAATATDEPSPVPPSATLMAVDSCVSCHTDKEQLISTAKPVEAAESESKGVG